MEFKEILDQFNIHYVSSGHRHARHGWIQLDCPFCGRDTGKLHLGYNISGSYCNCWRCGKKSVMSVMLEYTGKHHYGELKDLVGNLSTNSSVSIKFEGRGKVKRPIGVGRLWKQHIQYLQRRGFTKEDARLWGLKGIPVSIGFNWRIYIPIFYNGIEVSFTTRSIKDTLEMRYISAKESDEVYPHKKVLFGEHYARDAVIITEGPFDAMRIGPGAVATCGTTYSIEQVADMVKYPTRVVCFDSDPEAVARGNSLANTLSLYEGDTYVVTLDAKDAGSACKEEIAELRQTFIEPSRA